MFFLEKLKAQLSHDPPITQAVTYLREAKLTSHEAWIRTFIEVSFLKA